MHFIKTSRKNIIPIIMKTMIVVAATAVFVIAEGVSALPALGATGIAKIISYQGRLTDGSGVNVPDGTYNLKLVIYDAASGGTCIWSAKNTDANTATTDCGAPGALSVTVTGGLFNVTLGDTTGGLQNTLPAAVWTDDTRYLGITVNTDPEMAPRRELTAVYQALNALSLNSLATSATGGNNAFVPVTDAAGNLTLTKNVSLGGVGTLTTIGGSLLLGSAAADPVGTNGATYYNTLNNKFRCFENGAWKDCDTTGGTTTLQTAYNNGQTITTAGGDAILFSLANGNFNASGPGSVNLTPTGASQFTSAGSLTLTAGAPSTWSTSSGALTIDSAAALNLGATNATSVSIGKSGVTTTVNGPLTTNNGLTASGTVDLTNASITGAKFAGASPMVFDGATVDANKTTFAITDPTASRTITFPNASGTVAVSASAPLAIDANGNVTCATCTTTSVTLQNAYNGGNAITTAGATPIAFTLTSGNFNVTGAGAVNLTPTAASQFTSGGALTLTGGAASTWSTSAGNLTLQAGSGTVSLGTSTNLTAGGNLTIQPAAASALTLTSPVAATWSTSAGNLTLQAGSGTVSLGTSTTLSAAGGLNISTGGATAITSSTGNINLQPAGALTTANVQIGTGGAGSTTPDLLVADVKSNAGDPSGTNGAMYYNTVDTKFRCFEGGGWKDCDTTGGTTTLQTAYNSGATITTAAATDIAFTLTSGNFTAAGAGSVNLTPTAASQFTSAGALTLTAGAASTWGTTAGNLSLQAAGTGTTANIQIGTGAGSTTPDLLVADVKSNAGDPSGTNGAIYYNSSANKFRCFENSAWADCISPTGTVTGTGVNGQVSFWTGTNSQGGDSGFFWDNAAKRLGLGTNSPSAPLTVSVDDATNNSTTDLASITHTTTGTAAAGIGDALLFSTENGSGLTTSSGRIASLLTNVTNGAENSAITFQTKTGGGALTERLRIDNQGFLVPGATDNTEDIGTLSDRWRTVQAGTSFVVGTTTLSGGNLASTSSLNVAAGSGSNLVLTSGTDTVQLGAGTNEINNTDVGADLVLAANGNVKIKDGKMLILGSLAADPGTAVDGAEYYNTATNKRRCYVAGAWGNCNDTSGWTDSGSIVSLVTNSDQVGLGTSAPVAGTKFEVAIADGVNNNITNVITVDHTTTGTAANGIGTGTDYRTQNSTGTTTDAGHFNAFLTNATAGAEASAFSFETRTAGGPVAERFRITSAGVFPALTNNAEDLGGAGNAWQNAYLGTSTIINGNTTLSDGSLATATGNLIFPVAGTGTGSVIIGSGSASTTPDLLVLDAKTTGGDPSGANGAMYYNASANKFRCFENSTWKDCDTSGNTTLQSAYANGATIVTASATPILFTLTSGDFNVGGAGGVNLTPTSASQFTSAGSLTFTAGAASTWSTSSGALSLGSGSGTLKLAAATNTIGNTDATTDLDLKATRNITIDNTNLLVMANQASDPAGTDGATYYNTVSNKFRCFLNGSWSDCDTVGGTVNLQTAYNNGNAIITGSTTPIAFTLTSGNFNVSGAGAVNLTPSGASQFTSAGALTLTGGAASTWGTTAGNLSLQAAGTGTTANVQIGTGAGSTTPDLLVADVKSNAGDPTGTNGAMYYNTIDTKFRCFEGGAWKDCDTTGGTTTLQTAYNAGNSITTSGATPILFTLTSGDLNVGGAGGVNLTPTGASQFTSAGALTFTAGGASTWSTTSGALTITSAAAATWSTSAGNLSLVAAGSGAGNVQIGTGVASATPDLLVVDLKSTAGDPAGTDGAMYYNASSDKFRCYKAGTWQDCLGTFTDASGINTMKVATEQLQIGATTPPAGSKADISLDDASNNSASTVLVLDHTTTGTAANGIGTNLLFRNENDAGNPVNAAELSATLTNAANGTEDSDLRFYTQSGGSGLAERLRLTSAGTLQPGATNNSLDLGAVANAWRTGYFGTSVIVGGTTFSDNNLQSAGALNLTSGGGSAVTISSANGSLLLAAGTNELHNTDAATDIVVHATRNLKVDDASMLALSSKSADPSGTNGALYYNTVSNTFRCYVNGAWIDCAGGVMLSGSGTAGQITFWTGTSTQSGDNELFWDNTTKGLGIGTNDIHSGTKLEVEQTDAANNSIENVAAFEHNTTGTAANGLGAGILLRGENDSGTEVGAARLDGVMTSVVTGSETGAMIFETYSAGTLAERARIDNLGNLTFAQAANVSTSTGALTVDSAAALNLGTTNATSVALGRTGITTTNNGALTVTQTLTANGNITFSAGNITGASPLSFDGGTADANKTVIAVTDPTATRTITLPNASGTVAVSASAPITLSAVGDIGCSTCTVNGGPGSFTTLSSTGVTTLGNGSATVAINSSSWGITSTGVASGLTGLTTTGTVNLTGATISGASPMVFDGATVDANKTTFAITDPTASRTITFPNASGTVAVSASAPLAIDAAGNVTCATCTTTAVTLQNAYNGGNTITTASSTNIAFTLTSGDFNATGAGAVNLTPTAASQFTSGGALTLTGGAASTWSTSVGALTLTSAAAATWGTSAGNLSLQAAGAGTTANIQIGAGGAGSTTPDLVVLDAKSTTGNPTGTNGAMYYNVADAKFRCFENGAWKDCDTNNVASLQTAYNNGATITTAGSTNIAFTLTSGNFNATGAGAVNLTPTSASQFTSAGALTLTGGAASTWSTSSGALTLTSAAATTWSTSTGALTVDSAAALNLGTTNATSVALGRTGITTTNNGALTVTQTLTANGNITFSAGNITGASPLSFDGTTADANKTVLAITDPTATRTITLPNASGTVAVSASSPITLSAAGDIGCTSCVVTGGPGSFTTLSSTGISTIGNGSATVAINSSSWGITSAGVASGLTGLTTTGTVNLTGATISGASPMVFDGATVDANKTTFAITDPTASRTITFPNASGTVAVSASAPIAIDAAGNVTCATCVTSAATLQSAYNAGQTITTSGSHDIALTLTSGNLTASGAGSVNLTPTGTSSFTSAGALTLTGGAASSWTTSAGALTLTSAAAATWSTAAGALTITGNASLALDSATTGNVTLGANANAKTITIGNNTTTTALNITSGTGAQTFTSSNATGTTTASSFVFNDAALTSGTLLRLTSTSTSGKLADLNFTNTTGTIMNGAFGAATTQGAGALTGLAWDMNTNLTTPAAGQNFTGIDLKTPVASTTSNAAVYTGLNLSTAGAITNATAGSIAWRGIQLAMPNMTQSAGGSVTSSGLLVTTGTITTGGTQNGLNIAAAGVGAGTLNGLNISGITAAAGTENAINIGAGWDADITTASGNLTLQPAGTGTTANVQIGVGGAGSTTPDLFVLDAKSTTGNPTGTNGAMYYNATDNKFRCYENSTWKDCIHPPSVDSADDTGSHTPTPGTYPTLGTAIEVLTSANPSLTPTSTTSRILVTGATYYTNPTGGEDTNGEASVAVRRGSGNCTGTQVGSTLVALVSDPVQSHYIPFSFIDSPATTSAQAYTVCVALADSNGATATNATITHTMLTIQEISAAGADFAETYATNDQSLQAGDVVRVDPGLTNGVRKSSAAYDANVMGVISSRPGQVLDDGTITGKLAIVALAGRVPVKVSNENGPIAVGDFLVASSTPGVAMKAARAGMAIGQAISTPDTNGLAMMLIKNTYVPSSAFTMLVSGLSAGASSAVTDTDLLASLTSDLLTRPADQTPVDLNADRLSAGLSVVSPKGIFNGLSVDTIGSVHDLITFSSNISFIGTPFFNADTAGFAKVFTGSDHVDVTFSKAYSTLPIVNATIAFAKSADGSSNAMSALQNDVRFAVTNVTTDGFTITLNHITNSDLTFNWTALAVTDAKTFSSGDNAMTSAPVTSTSTPAASTPTPFVTTTDLPPATDTNTPPAPASGLTTAPASNEAPATNTPTNTNVPTDTPVTSSSNTDVAPADQLTTNPTPTPAAPDATGMDSNTPVTPTPTESAPAPETTTPATPVAPVATAPAAN